MEHSCSCHHASSCSSPQTTPVSIWCTRCSCPTGSPGRKHILNCLLSWWQFRDPANIGHCEAKTILVKLIWGYSFSLIFFNSLDAKIVIYKIEWNVTKYGGPYSEFVLCIYPIQSAPTQQWTHTRSSGQPFMLQHPGSSWGLVPCSRAPQSWYWKWRERWLFTPPPTIPARPETL